MKLFLGSSCVLCGVSTKQTYSLCAECENDLPTIEKSCIQCGIPLETKKSLCGKCLKEPSFIDYTFSLFVYESPIDFLIAELKFKQQLFCASILGHLMAKSLKKCLGLQDYPDVILPVPLHMGRLKKRGFNQSLEISRPISSGLNIPIVNKLARRIKSTRSQVDLSASQRKKNIKGCFQMSAMPAYKHVVLVDDVVTTGSTTNELARVLKESGVERVGVWTIARARIKE